MAPSGTERHQDQTSDHVPDHETKNSFGPVYCARELLEAVAAGEERTHPIIAVEGLDGSGKSTVVRELAGRPRRREHLEPAQRMRAERELADTLPEAERRAWYWQANREAMRDATDVVFAGRTVIMDRCFASTAAYAAAERGVVASSADVPRQEPRPDLIVLLSVDECERMRRLEGRGDMRTKEELRLSQDAAFRRRVLDGYAGLGVESIDASAPLCQVVDRIAAMVAPVAADARLMGSSE